MIFILLSKNLAKEKTLEKQVGTRYPPSQIELGAHQVSPKASVLEASLYLKKADFILIVLIKIKISISIFCLSHEVVTCDGDCDVSTAHC